MGLVGALRYLGVGRRLDSASDEGYEWDLMLRRWISFGHECDEEHLLKIYIIFCETAYSLGTIPDTRNSLSVSTFRSKLKTHLFNVSRPPLILSHHVIGLPIRIWFLFFLLLLARSNYTFLLLCLLTYKTLTNINNLHYTYLYSSLSFPSHSVSTRSSDSLVLSIPYVRSSLGKRAFSVIGPRLWNSITPSWYPKHRLLYQYSVPDSKHTSSKLRSLLGSFPSPKLDCLPGFWFLLFSFYALSNDTVLDTGL